MEWYRSHIITLPVNTVIHTVFADFGKQHDKDFMKIFIKVYRNIIFEEEKRETLQFLKGLTTGETTVD